MYSIDVVISKKERWIFKTMLSEKKLKFMEWFVEFDIENSIISFEVDDMDNFKDIFNFLKAKSPTSRLILPNGSNVKPSKKEFQDVEDFLSKFL